MDQTNDQPTDESGGAGTDEAAPVQSLGGIQPGVVGAVPGEPLLDGPTVEPRETSDPAPPLGGDASVTPLSIPTDAPPSTPAARERPSR